MAYTVLNNRKELGTVKEVVYHFEYDGNRIKCVRAVEKKQETPREKAAPWLVILLGIIAAIGVVRL